MSPEKRKKIALIFLVLILVLGGVFWIVSKFSPEPNDTVDLAYAEKTRIDKNSIDTDHDGLRDWEEDLWRTDPKNPDSDGDGTLDGKEVATRRDPRKAGKDTLETPTTLPEEGTVERTVLLATLTESLATTTQKNSLARYTFTSKDIATKSDSSPESLRAYGLLLADTLAQYRFVKPEALLDFVLGAMANDEPRDLTDLALARKENYRVISTLLAMKVPESAVKTHLGLLNALGETQESLDRAGRVFIDPVTALEHVDTYSKTFAQFLSSLETINGFFLAKKVLFSSSEQLVL